VIRVNGYPIDVALQERLDYTSEVTKSPVEKGADIADHVIARLPVLTFDGVVSDTPIGAVSNDESRLTLQGATPSQDAYRRFEAIHVAKQPVVVECSFGKFDHMVMTSLSATKESTSAKAFVFTATFEDVRIVENRRTTVRVAVPNVGKKQNFGLSLDKIIDGKRVLWRHGKPPGLSPATDPPGVITMQEVVTVKDKGNGRTGTYHPNGKELTTQEYLDYAKDLDRDASLMQRRAFARVDAQVEENGRRLEAAQRMLDYKEAHPGEKVDKAMFGL
jgi:hypothetical protein